MFHDITLEKMLQLQKEENHTIIDVRSPKEFEEATIPGSINIPVFTNEERAEVGTLYKQEGQEKAKEKGLELFSAKLPQFIASFKEIPTSMTVFCWRGGMRSKTAATVLELMGIHANRLSGGIRSYRQWIVHFLENASFHPPLIVLNGFTGTGKTEILRRLKDQGYPIMDFEGMANHRGSIFGQIGKQPSNQKKFDSLLVDDIIRLQDAPFVFVEGESRRIGRAVLPEFIYQKKEAATQLFIQMPMEERIQNILQDYEPWKYPGQIREAFLHIKKRIHTPIAKEIDEKLAEGAYPEAIELLLRHYYDPRYDHSIASTGQITIDAQNTDDAIHQIINMYPAGNRHHAIKRMQKKAQ